MPGDMGHAVGRVVKEHGYPVLTCLAGRSQRTRDLAAAAGFEDVANLDVLVGEADLILSILPPAQSVAQARAVADAIVKTGERAVFVDCNAISPATAGEIENIIKQAGSPFIDAGIVGLAPGKGPATRFYVSGDDTGPMETLNGKGLEVISIGDGVGRASALKMCYAGLTKGTWTLHTAVLLTAEALGVRRELCDEFEFSQKAAFAQMQERVPRLPADSERWIGEMEEISATFAGAGTPSGFHDAAAEIFRILARTPFAGETRETIDTSRTLDEAVTAYVKELKPPNSG